MKRKRKATVERIITSAEFDAKRTQMTQQLGALHEQLFRDIAFNSLAPCLGNSHEIFRELDAARQHIAIAFQKLESPAR